MYVLAYTELKVCYPSANADFNSGWLEGEGLAAPQLYPNSQVNNVQGMTYLVCGAGGRGVSPTDLSGPRGCGLEDASLHV